MSTLKRYPQRLRRGDRLSGFTLLETLIAGVLVIMTMTAVSRMGTSALAGSSNYAERRKIEADIETHIQLIQQADSLLTYERIPSAHQSSACLTPAKYLAKVLQENGQIDPGENWLTTTPNPESSTRYFPDIDQPSNENIKSITFTPVNDKDIVEVIYLFEPPEDNITEEYRRLELNPNFQSRCPAY